ncbi:hypothetical protein NDU88_008710 [Pleurodeles waltl]|uniref:Uncharacterized protein n=1 Tax=Pleurodeles waltl TaxID=8319 RepID=A0AAV7PSV0_PLEWA|nr:hypothetical protein NDU88_008710 [Pleurodeles waltl]
MIPDGTRGALTEPPAERASRHKKKHSRGYHGGEIVAGPPRSKSPEQSKASVTPPIRASSSDLGQVAPTATPEL